MTGTLGKVCFNARLILPVNTAQLLGEPQLLPQPSVLFCPAHHKCARETLTDACPVLWSAFCSSSALLCLFAKLSVLNSSIYSFNHVKGLILCFQIFFFLNVHSGNPGICRQVPPFFTLTWAQVQARATCFLSECSSKKPPSLFCYYPS